MIKLRIATPNPASEAFHQSMGFEKICEIPATGYKMREWHGISWYALRIDECREPKPIIPFTELDAETVEKALII